MADELFDPTGLGLWTEPTRFHVTREQLTQYAAATNDPIAAHQSGDVAPPVFAIVPVFAALLEPAQRMLAPELTARVVHGEQDFRFYRAIRPGDELTSRSKAIGFEGMTNGTRLVILIECRDAAGELVNEQYVSTFVRGFDAGRALGERAPTHKLPVAACTQSPVAKTTQRIDADQTFRYSRAAGDPMLIHLDDERAKSVGLPGIIAHGLCVQALTSWALLTEIADCDVTKLQRLAVRFAKPVLPGDEITTTFWRVASRDGVTTYAYECHVDDVKVISDGLAEIRE